MDLVISTAQQTKGTGGEQKRGAHDGVMLTAPNRKGVTRESIVLTAPGESQTHGPGASRHGEMHHTLSSTTLARGVALDIGHQSEK